MKKTLALAAGLFVAGLSLASAPASAVPFAPSLAAPLATEAAPLVETVQYGYGRRGHGYGYGRRGYRGHGYGYGRRGYYGGGPRYGGRGYDGGGYRRGGIGPGYFGPRF